MNPPSPTPPSALPGGHQTLQKMPEKKQPGPYSSYSAGLCCLQRRLDQDLERLQDTAQVDGESDGIDTMIRLVLDRRWRVLSHGTDPPADPLIPFFP